MKVKPRPASSRSQVSPRNLPARTPVLRTSYVGAAIKAMFHPRLFQICLWTFVNPFRINQVIEVTQRTSMIRLAWSALAFFSGLILAFAYWNMPLTIKLVLLPAISTLLLLLTSIDLKDSSTEVLGILILDVLLVFTCIPVQGTFPSSFNIPETIAFFIGFGFALGWGWLLARSGLNRSFLFWPMGVTCYVIAVAIASRGWLFPTLSRVSGSLSPGIYPALLLLVLIIFRMLNPIFIIRSFKHSFDTENCYQQNDCADSALDFQNLQFTGGDFPRSYPG